MQGQLPHLVGEHLLKLTGTRPATDLAYAFTSLDFDAAARRYGRVGGFAHMAILVNQLKASRPGALLLEEPWPEERAIHRGSRLQAIGRGADRQAAEAGVGVPQALSLRCAGSGRRAKHGRPGWRPQATGSGSRAQESGVAIPGGQVGQVGVGLAEEGGCGHGNGLMRNKSFRIAKSLDVLGSAQAEVRGSLRPDTGIL